MNKIIRKSLKNIDVKNEYRNLTDNIIDNFYIPLLKEATVYKRAVGFFSSSALIEVIKGIEIFVSANGGKIQLIATPHLSKDDIEAIEKGYELRDEIIKKSIVENLLEPNNIYEERQLNLLANLIAFGVLDIKIALTKQNNKMGMYHEKVGIISDYHNNQVAFTGSMNESATGFMVNYETIDVFCSWKGDNQDRINTKEEAFFLIWNDLDENISTIDFSDLKAVIMDKYKTETLNLDDLENYLSKDKEELEIENIDIDIEDDIYDEVKVKIGASIPDGFALHDYQIEAIDNWEENEFCGIFDMATGTGKTYTGLGAISRLSSYLDHKIAVFIVSPYQHLVEQWVEDIEKFNINPIVGYSASKQKDWKNLLKNAVLDQKLGVNNREFFCFVSTNATFASDYVQSQINKLRGNAIIVVDEAHNFGATYLSKLLTDRFKYRLALSATINRHHDDEGTEKLFRYFGKKCIEYTLERAIEEGKLTKYKYFPIITTLNEYEYEKYINLTVEIGQYIFVNADGSINLSEKAKKLLIARARLIAGCEDKIIKLEEVIEQYKNEKHMLVYCGATTMLAENQEFSTTDNEDIRQIDLVTDLLGNKLNMKVSQFTSKEDMKEREILKEKFSEGKELQTLIAIKCLDEGVNIPKIKLAFILASTTNPKEYIQRRGRVLRLAKDKEFAVIYDFVVLPRDLDDVFSLTDFELKKDLSLVKNELKRLEEFSGLAMNYYESQRIINDIKEAYYLDEDFINYEEDFGYGE